MRRTTRRREAGFTAEDLILTTSTSEAYSFVFRLLCDPGDAVLVPTPSYPLFDFLGDLNDVKLVPYELVYDHGWQIDFESLRAAMSRPSAKASRCRAVLVVHPNNPTGSYVKPHEVAELSRICAANEMAIIADEVFLDYPFGRSNPANVFGSAEALTFTLSGLSKISALPQMKVAWIATTGPEALKREALARLAVIADTYLSMNAPTQLALPTMLEERHDIQAQIMQRIRANLAELDAQLADAEPVSAIGRRGRMVRAASRSRAWFRRGTRNRPVAQHRSAAPPWSLLQLPRRRIPRR